jgi:hypothetical protein
MESLASPLVIGGNGSKSRLPSIPSFFDLDALPSIDPIDIPMSDSDLKTYEAVLDDIHAQRHQQPSQVDAGAPISPSLSILEDDNVFSPSTQQSPVPSDLESSWPFPGEPPALLPATIAPAPSVPAPSPSSSAGNQTPSAARKNAPLATSLVLPELSEPTSTKRGGPQLKRHVIKPRKKENVPRKRQQRPREPKRNCANDRRLEDSIWQEFFHLDMPSVHKLASEKSLSDHAKEQAIKARRRYLNRQYTKRTQFSKQDLEDKLIGYQKSMEDKEAENAQLQQRLSSTQAKLEAAQELLRRYNIEL